MGKHIVSQIPLRHRTINIIHFYNIEFMTVEFSTCSSTFVLCAQSSSYVQPIVTPWTVARQAHLSMGILQARILEWVAMPSSRGSSQLRDQTHVCHVAGGFFTIIATREVQEYCSGQPVPSPANLSIPEIKSQSPVLQVNSLPAELPGKPLLPLLKNK